MTITPNLCEIQTVYNYLKDHLSRKQACGARVRCEEARTLLPPRSRGCTVQKHMLCIAYSTTIAS